MKLSKVGLLKALEIMGKDVADHAEPGFYPRHQMNRAEGPAKFLVHCRTAYRNINNDIVDHLSALLELETKVPGVFRNHLNLIILAYKGELNPNNIPGNWSVIDGHLKFVDCMY